MIKKYHNITLHSLILVLGLIIVATSCARVQRSKSVEATGFLKDYSQLKAGEKDQALMIYVNPDAHFAKYTKVMIDKVEIWQTEDSKELEPKDARQLSAALYRALEEQLKEDYTVVRRAGEGVLRFRVAITEARRSKVPFDVITTYLPQGLVISWGKELTTGTHAFVGKAAVEFVILDSATNERIVAGVDARGGAKVPKSDLSSWNDVKAAFSHWAEMVKIRLGELRGKQP
jgi:hypothetical protein